MEENMNGSLDFKMFDTNGTPLANTIPTMPLEDEEVNVVSETLNKVLEASDTLKEIANLKSNGGDLDISMDEEETEQKVNININPVTGEHVVVGVVDEEPVNEEKEEFLEGTFEELWEKSSETTIDLSKVDIPDNMVIEMLKERFDIYSIADISAVLNIIKEYKNGETSNMYNRLPQSIKSFIDNGAIESGATENISLKVLKNYKNQIAKELIEDLITDIGYENATIDFNEEMSKLLSSADEEIKTLYSESIKDKIDQLDKLYEQMKENNDTEKIDQVLGVKESLIESHDLIKFREALYRIKIKRIDIEKPQKHYRDFDYKYSKCVYKIHSVSLLHPILQRVFGDEYSHSVVLAFIIAFCKYTANMHPENIVEHTFMYYFISNIIFLNTTNSDQEYEVSLKENIKACLDILNDKL